jgi:hypothetical protein
MKLFKVLTLGLLLSCGVFLLFHFSCIVKYGKFYISEPNVFILVFEIALISLSVLAGLYHLIKEIKDTPN